MELTIKDFLTDVKRALASAALIGAILFLGVQTANADAQFPFDAKNSCSFSHPDFYNNPKAVGAESSFTTLKLPTAKASAPIGPFYDTDSGMVYVFPPDGPGFESSSNCEFFEWAAQMFLWSTSTVLNGLSVPASTTTPSGSSPYVFNSEFFYRFSDGKLIPQSADTSSSDSKPSFALRTRKIDDPFPQQPSSEEGVTQAGSQGILISQAENTVSKKSSLVYYGVHTNRILGYTAAAKLQGFPVKEFPANGASVCEASTLGILEGYTPVTPLSFGLYALFCLPSDDRLQRLGFDRQEPLSALTETAATSTFSIPQLELAIDYLSMVVELKTSWVAADSVVNKADYILQVENVPTYTPKTNEDGSIYWKQTGEAATELAMVGMHIVGTVKGHPEMIWATIEHVNNAPNAAYSYTNSSNDIASYIPSYTGSTSGANSGWLFADGTNEHQNKQTAKAHGENIYPEVAGDAIEPTNVVRTHPWGVKANKTDAAKISSELISLNTNIAAVLQAFNKNTPSNPNNQTIYDPRQNYYVSGATWGVGGHIPTKFNSASTNIAGSAYLANSTMETFEQDQGCFGCHSADTEKHSSSINNLSISHIFDKITDVVKVINP